MGESDTDPALGRPARPPSPLERAAPVPLAAPLVATALAAAACSGETGGDCEPAAQAPECLFALRASVDRAAESAAELARAGQKAPARARELARERMLDPETPLPAHARERLRDVEFDPHPEELTRDSHYWVSNEDHHDVFREPIEGHGGVYLGVGTDQNYLMAAWAESPILLLVDFDEEIRNIHHVYGVIFSRAEDPESFIEAWSSERADDVRAWLAEEYPDDERRAALERAFRVARATIYARLRRVAADYEERGVPAFVTDRDQYAFVRGLWRNGRVVPLRGDLTGDRTMVDIARALEDLDLRLGLLYTSNAEQYFEFSPAYRRNITHLPLAEDGYLLRTRPMRRLGYAGEDDYHYNLQNLWNFAAWLEQSRLPGAGALLVRHREPTEAEGLSRIRAAPPLGEPAPEVADAPPETP